MSEGCDTVAGENPTVVGPSNRRRLDRAVARERIVVIIL